MKKQWYKSKGCWGALLLALGAVGGYLTGDLSLLQAFEAAAAALGLYGIRDAQKA